MSCRIDKLSCTDRISHITRQNTAKVVAMNCNDDFLDSTVILECVCDRAFAVRQSKAWQNLNRHRSNTLTVDPPALRISPDASVHNAHCYSCGVDAENTRGEPHYEVYPIFWCWCTMRKGFISTMLAVVQPSTP